MLRSRLLARRGLPAAAISLLALLALIAPAPGWRAAMPAANAASVPTGGTSPSGSAPTHKRISRRRWLNGFTITEYWPAPETWFVGKLVAAPGLPGQHRIDWLYSAMGLAMQGEGVGLDGRMYHIASFANASWVTAAGRPAGASGGAPFWLDGAYWRTRSGAVTFPLQAGGWSAGTGRRYVPLRGVTFAPGASLPLTYYQSIAVDPKVIPLGSRVYIPAYGNDGRGGWFTAQDTGGAIAGRHIDVFRPPPAAPTDGGQYLTSQRVLVQPPKHAVAAAGSGNRSPRARLGCRPLFGAALRVASVGPSSPSFRLGCGFLAAERRWSG
jgi:3D (Asp-Asp-Asp) domain-containing protein